MKLKKRKENKRKSATLGGFEIGREMELEREVFLSPLHIAEREGSTGNASV